MQGNLYVRRMVGSLGRAAPLSLMNGAFQASVFPANVSKPTTGDDALLFDEAHYAEGKFKLCRK